jgi:hypothetical protein
LFVTVGEARYVAEWALNASQPASFVNSFSNRGRDFYTLAFNGVQGTLISNDVVRKAPDVAAVYGMVYNRCELHAAACGVVVTRLANIGIEGRSFYALGVMSVREPFLWYTVLLDEETGLPFAYWMRDAVLYVRDYARGSSGEMIPSYWRFDRTNSQVEVIHVREAAGLPR